MKTVSLLNLLILFTLCFSAFGESKPNVIIVMTDDQGYGELSRHGNPILKTPNLDQLAEESLRFIDFHVAPMCTPTRGQLMTGLDAARNGAINVSSGRALMRPELKTMADIFKSNGYKTGIFGKWHLGDNYPFRPEDRGFDEAIWFPSSHIGSVPDFWGNDYFDDTYIHNTKRKKFNGYCTDIFFDEAMRFINESQNQNKPFLTFIPTNTPHGPLIAKEEDKKAIAEAFEKAKFARKDPKLKNVLMNYLGMVRNIDSNMGKLLKFLNEKGLKENTIVIFTTDNGTTYGHRYFNAGMRGSKTELWEGGHRVPFFLSWPKGGLSSPRDIDGLAQIQDVLPTLIDLCELKSHDNFDGINLSAVLKGKEQIDPERMLIISYSRMPTTFNYPSPFGQSLLNKHQAGVLWKKWRLLENRELYNLSSDPLQEKNVFAEHPEVVKKMQSHLDTWWDGVKDIANEPQRIVVGHSAENPMMITACEWLDVFIDQQRQIKRGVLKSGYWLLDVAEAGDYEIELSRWPKELGIPISKAPENGKEIKISSASLYINKHNFLSVSQKRPYGFEGLTKRVKPNDVTVKFNVKLKAGPIALHTFLGTKWDSFCSAYYVYITKK